MSTNVITLLAGRIGKVNQVEANDNTILDVFIASEDQIEDLRRS